jgi:hypothetical protein
VIIKLKKAVLMMSTHLRYRYTYQGETTDEEMWMTRNEFLHRIDALLILCTRGAKFTILRSDTTDPYMRKEFNTVYNKIYAMCADLNADLNADIDTRSIWEIAVFGLFIGAMTGFMLGVVSRRH